MTEAAFTNHPSKMRQLGILIFMSLIFMATTCERSLEIGFPEDQDQLVVIGNFTNNQNLQVQVSLTEDVLNSENIIRYVNTAQIRLFQGDQFIERLVRGEANGGAPFYTTQNFNPQTGVPYNIEILVNGFDPIMATSEIPESINIQSLEINNLVIEGFPSNNMDRYSFDLNVAINDPANESNFYHLKVFQQFEKFTILRNDTFVVETPIRELVFSPALNNNFQVAHYEGGILLEDTPFDGDVKQYSFPIQIEVAADEELPGKIIAELRTVSEEYYHFYTSVSRQQTSPGQPIAEPVIIF